jgi:hypothetical protein
LYELHQKIRENQLCVIFRNNHFASLFKYKSNLYSLITDSGFLHEPIVWERLNEVDNDTAFCNSEFMEITDVTNVVDTISNDEPDMFQPSDKEIQEQLLIELKIEEQQHKMDEEYVIYNTNLIRF